MTRRQSQPTAARCALTATLALCGTLGGCAAHSSNAESSFDAGAALPLAPDSPVHVANSSNAAPADAGLSQDAGSVVSGPMAPASSDAGTSPIAPMPAAGAPASISVPAAATPAAINFDCSRSGLSALIEAYFSALAAHDPSTLPLAATLKMTQNAKPLKLGEGLWTSAGEPHLKRSALDTERCGTATEAVIDLQGTQSVVGVRLLLQAGTITEVEMYVPETFAGAAQGLLDSAADDWGSALPSAQQRSRAQLETIADAYLQNVADPQVEVPYAMPCDRLVNGLGSGLGNASQHACDNVFLPIPGLPSLVAAPTHRRYPVTDVEAGIAVAFALVADNVLSFHMLKVIDGKIRFLNSVIAGMSSSTGWE